MSSTMLSSFPSSALRMAHRNDEAGRGPGRSASAVASPAAPANADASSSNNQKKDKPKQQRKNNGNDKKKKQSANTGRLRLLPPLQPSSEILSRAYRQTYHEIKDDLKVANQRRRTQKRGAQTIDSLCQKLCAPLKKTVETYRRELRYMHPFERVVMDLTVRARQKRDGLTLSHILEDVHEGRKELLHLSKDWIAKIKSSPTAREAYETTEEAKENIGKVFVDLIDEPWGGVTQLQKSLRNVPTVRLDCPAVVLVGAPNVGKSSIVRAISSGTPEVNNYPFTTRGMTLGHVQVFWESDEDVAAGNVAGVSIPSEKELVAEKLVKRGVKTRRMRERDALEKFSREKNDRERKESLTLGEMEKADIEAMIDGAAGEASSPAVDGTDSIEEEVESTMDHSQTDNFIPPPAKPTISKRSFPISQLCQIMDSPGLLRRDPTSSRTSQRNEMEELTLAAMAHLPTAVMYVMDLSGGAGDKCSSVEDQLVLRREVRERFPRRPWVDVVSKCDLGVVEGGRARLMQIIEAEREQQQQGGDGGSGEATGQYFIELSVKERSGVEDLRQEVMRMLGEVRVVLDAMAAMDERSARAV